MKSLHTAFTLRNTHLFIYFFIKICQRAVYSTLYNDYKNISNNHDDTVGWDMASDMSQPTVLSWFFDMFCLSQTEQICVIYIILFSDKLLYKIV